MDYNKLGKKKYQNLKKKKKTLTQCTTNKPNFVLIPIGPKQGSSQSQCSVLNKNTLIQPKNKTKSDKYPKIKTNKQTKKEKKIGGIPMR